MNERARNSTQLSLHRHSEPFNFMFSLLPFFNQCFYLCVTFMGYATVCVCVCVTNERNSQIFSYTIALMC